ncbi:MAG: helix-turn-helix transcriptional regulator [Alphaproteobacteria bacterium]|nr:helix-turn-helix transcriptional regulator [Alphaproteobacteria bacterium]
MQGTKRKTKGTADIIDKHVGLRIRNRRTLMGLSQEKLADSVGVTFQQVQKYERGTNRVSASRLYRFSKTLGVSIDFFYEGLDNGEPASGPIYGMADNKQDNFEGISEKAKAIPEDLLTHKETLELVRTYYSMTDVKKRKEMLRFVKFMAQSDNN